MTEEKNRQLQTVNVCTIFIKYENKILILKRSDKVGTFQGKWAGVSGFIESWEIAEVTALKEIQEETGLGKGDIKFIKKGDPVSVIDGDRHFIVHPFLFESKTPEIKLDWEHVDYKWIEPGELLKYDTVPLLIDVFKSVLQ
jgi:8-oxo-dGTP pyrophosphatase MutT (NUDIX family)